MGGGTYIDLTSDVSKTNYPNLKFSKGGVVKYAKTAYKDWEIVTVSPSTIDWNNVRYTFDSKYNDWDWTILNSGQNLEADHWFTTEKGTNFYKLGSRNLSSGGTTYLTYTRNGNVITATADNGYSTGGKREASNLTVLFYK